MFLEVSNDKEQKNSAAKGEQSHHQHTRLEADLLGREGEGGAEIARQRGGGYPVGDNAQKLGGNGGAQIAAGGHESKSGHTGIGHPLLHHDQGSRPQHGGENSRQNTGNEGGHHGGGQTDHQVAGGGAYHTREQDGHDILAEFGVGDAGQTQENGEHGNTQNVPHGLIHAQGVFHESRNPVAHGVFRAATEEDASHAESHAHGAALGAPRFPGSGGGIHVGHGGDHEQYGRDHGQSGQNQNQSHPVFRTEHLQKQRAEQYHGANAEGVQRVEQAHIPLGIIRGHGGDGGAEQNLGKTCRDREYDGTCHQSQIGVLRKKGGDEGVGCQTDGRDEGHNANHDLGVKILGKEGENKVDSHLGAEIGQHQGSQKGVGNAVGLPQGDEKQGGNAEDGGHGEVGGIASKAGSLVVGAGVLHDGVSV